MNFRHLVAIGTALLGGAFTAEGAEKKLLTPQVSPQRPPQQTARQAYTIPAGDFYDAAKAYGFNVAAHSGAFGATCDVNARRSDQSGGYPGQVLLIAGGTRDSWGFHAAAPLGSKCDFTVFEPATLRNGFTFKTWEGSVHKFGSSGKCDIALTSTPPGGSTSVKFTLHGWSEGSCGAYYDLRSITLEGPAGRDWREATH